MWFTIMVMFLGYAVVFILFEDYDRSNMMPFREASDWHLLAFSIVVMSVLGILLHRYSKSMDERITREQQEKHNQMRRELTQNISHELKTPVASILGYTETIINTPDIDNALCRQFVERAHGQAQRLTALLQDISTLNRMDYASSVITMERVDVSKLFADIVDETAILFSKKRMTLSNCLPCDIIVNGNYSLIYSIFRNLIDNSLNYAGQGVKVEISAYEQSGYWHFTFADNGAGIPEEHLQRIFERFYRVDKGRSRQLGGTGLGLAIVKNAVLLHHGTISAKTTDGGGLTLYFSLKK